MDLRVRLAVEVHQIIYFASIAAALVRHGEQISKSKPGPAARRLGAAGRGIGCRRGAAEAVCLGTGSAKSWPFRKTFLIYSCGKPDGIGKDSSRSVS